jgi:hypothetical protein
MQEVPAAVTVLGSDGQQLVFAELHGVCDQLQP